MASDTTINHLSPKPVLYGSNGKKLDLDSVLKSEEKGKENVSSQTENKPKDEAQIRLDKQKSEIEEYMKETNKQIREFQMEQNRIQKEQLLKQLEMQIEKTKREMELASMEHNKSMYSMSLAAFNKMREMDAQTWQNVHTALMKAGEGWIKALS